MSLKTTDLKQAKTLANGVRSKFDREFAARRREVTPLDAVELQGIAHRTYGAEERLDDHFRLTPPTEADLSAIWRVIEKEYGPDSLAARGIMRLVEERVQSPTQYRQEHAAELAAEVGRYLTRTVDAEVAEVVRELGLGAAPGSEDWKRIAHALQRGKLAAYKTADERDAGDWSGEVRDPMVKAPAVQRAKAGEGIMDLFAQYEAENPDNVRPDTLRQTRDAVRLFVESLPPRSSVTAINKAAVREWKALLIRFPVRAVDTVAFKGMAIRDVVAENDRLGKPTISKKTINRYLSSLGAFSNWLVVVRGLLDANPVRDLYLKIDKSRVTTLPFTVDQMKVIFSSDAFTAPDAVRDHTFWLPLVMLFSGARPGELAQLAVADVRQMHGVNVLHITTEGAKDKTLKTRGSARVVPVHPELVRLGFLEHVEAMRAAGQGRVFPEATRNARGQWVDKFSREFPRLLARLKVKDGRGLSLYSYRHTAADAFRRAGYADEAFGPLLGHAKASTTGLYGTESQGTIAQRAAMIDAIAYEGLDLSHLYPAP